MRDTLPVRGPLRNERGVVNLDINSGHGTHWVAYKKKGDSVHYFDSYGNLRPPKELCNYFRRSTVYYNREIFQKGDSIICGHLCLRFLST